MNSFEDFIDVAFMAGLAVLSVIKQLTPEQKHSYRAMFFLFQRVRRTREHLQNALLNATSLRISRVGREGADGRSILPETVGLNQQGQGTAWSVDRLLCEGRQAAREAGVEKPIENECVRFGLVAAARLNPLTIPANPTLELVRQALFNDIPADDPIEPEVVDVVVERALAAVHQHLTEPADAFDRWFSGRTNSFVGQIARRRLLPGGQLDQTAVRRALHDLGWQAYRYMADCIHAIMGAFEKMIPEPLTAAERTFFEQMHLNQPYLGNLPIVLMYERFSFTKEVLWDIWANPSDQHNIGVLHRLLDWFSDMARKRRQIDRSVKQRQPATDVEGAKTRFTVPLPEMTVEPESDEEKGFAGTNSDESAVMQLLDNAAQVICEQRKIKCQCGRNAWRHQVVSSSDAAVILKHTCNSCPFETTSRVTIEEFKQALHN